MLMLVTRQPQSTTPRQPPVTKLPLESFVVSLLEVVHYYTGDRAFQ